MELIVGTLLFANILLGGLLLTDYVYRSGGTMEERKAIVFEIYRYSICFVMVIVFGLMAFQLVGALVTDPGNTTSMAGPAIGALLSGVLFLIHWMMKNPALPKASG